MSVSLLETEIGYTERPRKEGNVKTKEGWCSHKPRATWSHQKLEAARKDPALEPSEGAWLCWWLHVDFWSLKLWEYISAVNLWNFVTAAPCNEDTYHPKFSTLAAWSQLRHITLSLWLLCCSLHSKWGKWPQNGSKGVLPLTGCVTLDMYYIKFPKHQISHLKTGKNNVLGVSCY